MRQHAVSGTPTVAWMPLGTSASVHHTAGYPSPEKTKIKWTLFEFQFCGKSEQARKPSTGFLFPSRTKQPLPFGTAQQHTPTVVSRAVTVLSASSLFTNTSIMPKPPLSQESWATKCVSQTREIPNCPLKIRRNEIPKIDCLETELLGFTQHK